MDIKMPKLGESVHEGTIEQWLVSVGDRVEEYDPLCEVITDKVTAEVPSSFAGVVTALHAEPGDIVSIGTVICSIEVENSTQHEENHMLVETSLPASESLESTTQPGQSAAEKNNGRYSPVVFKLASAYEIDLNQVPGTGFNGRVTKKDMMHYIENNKQTQNKELSDKPKTTNDSNNSRAEKTIPVNGVRRQIANKMAQSVQEIPHAWMQIEVDATELVKTREHYKASFKEQEGYNLTYFAFFIKAVAETLKKYPMLNSSWKDDEIVIHDGIHLSIAVAHNDQLYVPVIHHADEKSIKGIAKEIHTLAMKVRNNQLTTSDMTGGTFTVNNTGTFGSVSSMGIINHPQAAILQVESIVKRPVIVNDMIAIRHMVNLCLSIDHRILDGLQAGMFLNDVKQQIEHMTLDQTSIY
ncbi:2-oxo acid dehydrogenase subunit E2 [Staphylococcus muscae]|uniref:Dihydrolipoamide acetyltransferase component of pyruvate dehydrogenase complex n=2 Tax=Staphylococcus muscae TaxID=1294 RepID=A0A240C467_9STAP|nr:dihydrolipoamide acetyltransferase family protein [Staphylococcus muscae]AVQ33113.1 2-oxo acid dehydrogenase subunit E2 [Staphylococcus muscae]PNZ04748.1 2-oxo acid dehydrogenase subunit E2 [Staphylococcus muscae]GGA88278.1 dihydrolipoamide acetyltransferase component of pyruvate dehydrogenase complex [Staphylococcus muscae]SNW02559.1 branched-chain alpha-keto aciddehydrogenase complex lipoamide acyltransferase subunit [Staphylococcus muscae]